MIILERFLDDPREPAMGCMGELIVEGEHFCYTMEQPWRQNRRFVSCVPVGTYNLISYDSPKYGETFALENEDNDVFVYENEADEGGRYACLFHSANWAHQLQGCIAPGDGKGWAQHRGHPPNLMVTRSRDALARLFPVLEYNHQILIRWRHQR